METRVEKFRRYREEIKQQSNDLSKNEKEYLVDEVTKNNTLTMTINQIIEAHDKYVSKQAQDELILQEKVKQREHRIKKVKKIATTIGAILVASIVIILSALLIVYL